MKDYLLKRGYHPQTIYCYENVLQKYIAWCQKNYIDPAKASLNDLYDYKRDCLAIGLSGHTTRQRLSVIKHYFASLEAKENPALLIKHRKQDRTLPADLLSEEALKELYKSLIAKTILEMRNKVMLGILIFQGVKRDELDLLELHHLSAQEATIYIPATTRTNARTLDLHPMQMASLLNYLYEYRNKLLLEASKETDRLFFSMGTGNCITNALYRMIKDLKLEFPSLKTVTQIKESRMSIWVQQYGIRKAQYLSGIKYTSSMLRYKTTDIEKLKQKLAIVHPLERLNNCKNVTSKV